MGHAIGYDASPAHALAHLGPGSAFRLPGAAASAQDYVRKPLITASPGAAVANSRVEWESTLAGSMSKRGHAWKSDCTMRPKYAST